MAARKIHEVAAGVKALPISSAIAVSKAVRRVAETEAMRVAGADRRLSNLGRRGTVLSTRDTLQRGESAARSQLTIWARPAGGWAIVTTGAEPHLIGVGRASTRTGNYQSGHFRGRRKLLSLAPDVVRTAPVFHPGVPGQQAWTRVATTSRRIVPQILRQELHRAMG